MYLSVSFPQNSVNPVVRKRMISQRGRIKRSIITRKKNQIRRRDQAFQSFELTLEVNINAQNIC